MSLVAYGSSDESSEDSDTEQSSSLVPTIKHEKQINPPQEDPEPNSSNSEQIVENVNITKDDSFETEGSDILHFNTLPKPKNHNVIEDIIEEEDDIPLGKEINVTVDNGVKKERAPVKIVLPSLSEFKDVEEENEKNRKRIMPSQKGTGLFALLPPPKGSEFKSQKPLIPHVLTKNAEKAQPKPTQNSKNTSRNKSTIQTKKPASSFLGISNYDSNSDEEEDNSTKTVEKSTVPDFFSLTTPANEPIPPAALIEFTLPEIPTKNNQQNSLLKSTNESSSEDNTENSLSVSKKLVSNVIDLPREEIVQKNKAEVGPKLPVPEQEYNVDPMGNVAFDEKAIEYLCGKRGVKRKNKEIDEANIIEINGEDIKPDEREWLVKALTEEPVQRPISMHSAGVNSQSKKKHQITYLAHQAKAMEMELKNQWAQNRMTRQQTQSKYGF